MTERKKKKKCVSVRVLWQPAVTIVHLRRKKMCLPKSDFKSGNWSPPEWAGTK